MLKFTASMNFVNLRFSTSPWTNKSKLQLMDKNFVKSGLLNLQIQALWGLLNINHSLIIDDLLYLKYFLQYKSTGKTYKLHEIVL